MVLQHCSNCDGRHPPPLDGRCPFPTCEQPAPKRTTRRTRRSPSLSPPPPPKRGRGQPRRSRSPSMTPPPPPPPPTKRGRGRPLGSKGKKKAPPRRHQSPEASFDAQDQPDSPHSSACSTPRNSGMQPPPATQLVVPQVAAIQAIADQLARMQQEARDYQAAAARDREADRQEMLRRTAATQPAPGPSHPDVALARLPHPPPSASQESRRATAGQPAPGTSQEDPALSRYRQLRISLLYLRFFVVPIFWCLARKIPKRKWRPEHTRRQNWQLLQHFCQFLGVSAFEINEIILAANCNYWNFDFIGGWINNGGELQAEIYRIFREFILL